MIKIPNVIIIGAGTAGIATAVRLNQKGFNNFLILEAESRLGGRINSVKFGDSFVDVGAQWCHGEENNIVYEMVKNLNLLAPSFNTYADHTFYQNGKPLDKNLFNCLFELALETVELVEDLNNLEKSYGDAFIQNFREKLEKSFKENHDKDLIDDFIQWFHSFILCYEASPTWSDISISNNQYTKAPGNQLLQWKGKGFKTFLDVLMQKYSDKLEKTTVEDRILLDKKVCSVIYDRDNEDYNVEIHCTDKSIYRANQVVCTIPLGPLKKYHATLFNPPLPECKINAINGLGFGAVTKIFLKFNQKWWPNNCTGFSLMWNANVRENVHRKFPQFVKDGKTWLEGVFGFYVIDENPTVLLGWLTGPLAGDVQNLQKEQIIESCYYLLDCFIGKTYQIPLPQDTLTSEWINNPNFLGTWSYRSLASQNLKTSALHLAEPIRKKDKNVLLFAGEATHPHFYSTVHGAVESGFREADRIMSESNIERKLITVIGGGISGMSAALTLLKHKINDFVILEADSRLGGRINTIYYENKPLEMGAQWIHGSTNEIYEIAKKHNLISKNLSREAGGLYVREDGYVFNEDLVKLVDFKVGKILEECERFTDSSERPQSVGHYLQERFLQELNKVEESRKSEFLQLLDWHERFQKIDNSCNDLKDVSAKEWGKYSCPGLHGQEHVNLTNGFKSLIDILSSQIDQANVNLNTTVRTLKWKNSNDNCITVICTNGKIYKCDHVIMTCSLGVLKRNQDEMFIPSLPKNISSAIQTMGFGGVGKVYMVFENKWWNNIEGFQFIWLKNKYEIVEENSWTRHISGIDSIYNHPNILVVWVGGEGLNLMESLPTKTLGVHCVNLLKKFLKRNDIPYPIEIFRSTWLNNSLVSGGYSYSTPENDEEGKNREQLLEPAFDKDVPRIFLAGEAVHLNHFSTVHGAFESGQSQTLKLIDYFNTNKKKMQSKI